MSFVPTKVNTVFWLSLKLPDQPDHLNPGATVATNVYHAQTSYKPVKGLVAYSGASNVTQNAKGAGS